ncbi:S1 RNA-binding domain-containing protein [Mycoplasma iguanae]|uniref:S1 RNA-binding domain-containing protein n=1 Tax=Mycoplasma iguanae TaxID=292461 RepID=A0ABY5RBG3_9MOLU|nr:S1 RNA-binding domain-containing protein [Mycoplasma iguanae]UVD81687.1 S1 RNA-binding domain-containing protein [Mycoplasma iguanae]
MNKNQIVKGIVKSIHEKHFWVDLEAGYQGVVFINEISDFFVKKISNIVKVGEVLLFKVLTVNIQKKKVTLSYKAVKNKKRITNFFVYQIKPTKNGFLNLQKHAEEEIYSWKK